MKKYIKWLGPLVILLAVLIILPVSASAAGPGLSGPWFTFNAFPFEIVSFSGQVESLPPAIVPGEWTVAGQKVYVGFGTRFNVSPATIQVGDYVKVKAIRDANDSLVALQIFKFTPNEVQFVGIINEMGDGYWVVGDRTVVVNDDTLIVGDHPDVGDKAGVNAVQTEDGLVAKQIAVADADRTVTFPGVIRAMNEGSWIIATPAGDKTVIVNEDTVIEGDSPDVGDRVKVWATANTDLEIVAVRIKVTDTPRDVHFRGRIQEIGDGYWVIANQKVLITAETSIEGDEPSVGDMAEVWASLTEEGLVAKRIVVTSLNFDQVKVIKGVVESQGPDSWVIAGETVMVTAETQIKGHPQVGDAVVAVVVVQDDGTMVARNISRVPQVPDGLGGGRNDVPKPPVPPQFPGGRNRPGGQP
jgi:hypothetical protein